MQLWQIVLIVAGAVAAGTAVGAWLYQPQLRFAMRVARALATDRRLPRPLRRMIAFGLAIKAVPGPDLGIDEVLLAAAGLWILVRHRATFRAIVAESKTVRQREQRPATAADSHAGTTSRSVGPR